MSRKVLVIGDPIEDVYHYGSIIGISAETPTMVMKKKETKVFQGGSNLVYIHLKHLGVDALRYVIDPFVRKTRFFVDGYKLFQMDEIAENYSLMSREANNPKLKQMISEVDFVVVSDNQHGLLDEAAATMIVHLCKSKGKKLFVDAQLSQKVPNHSWWYGCDYMLLNQREAVNVGYCSPKSINTISKKYDCDVIIKLGENGSIASICSEFIQTPGVEVKAVDTCGAGDAFLAGLISSMGVSPDKVSLQFANTYAAGTCAYIGTGVGQ